MITGVVLARNEQENIVNCLESLRPHVAEIILIDMESTDKTVELARPFVSKVLSHPLVSNFDPARNIAIREAGYDWLWFLDADERIPQQTGQLIHQMVRERGNEAVAITIPFKSYFCGKWIQHCGWWPGYTMPRVLKRGHFAFAEKLHAGVQFDGPELRIEAHPNLAIEHFSYRSIEHYVDKFNRYTTTEAQNLAELGATHDWQEGIRVLVRDLWLYYERNQGRKDGYFGWILSWLAGQYRWFSLAKLADMPEQRAAAETAAIPSSLDDVFSLMNHELLRLRSGSLPQRMGVVFHTPLFDPSGYAEDGRMLLKALSLGDRPLTAVENRWSDVICQLPEPDTALFRALARGTPPVPAIRITNCIPTLVEPDPNAEFNALRTTFETDRIPEYWLPNIERFDEVWVLARHNEVAFRRGGVAPDRIRVLPEFIDTALFSPQGPKLALPSSLRQRFVFLSVLDWQLRKGWDVLLKAYCEEFSPQDRVGLLLKITKLHGHTLDQIRQQVDSLLVSLNQNLEKRPDICIWDHVLEQTQMAALYRSVNAFVIASRGEGWGRPYMEAMATGLPTIGTRGSGNEDFMNDDNSFLIDTVLTPVSEEAARELSVYRGHAWQEPDLMGLRRSMRTVFRDRGHAKKVGKKALAHIRTAHSLSTGNRVLENMIRATEQRLRPQPVPPASVDQVCVQWEGEFFAGHSFANINEELTKILTTDNRLALALHRIHHNPVNDRGAVHRPVLQPYFDRALPCPPRVVIRHAFPPNWQPPEHGRWVHIQPWEFGSLPRDWVPPLRDQVDEIWAPSSYVKDVYVRSGISADKIFVIPWGIDPFVYRPDVPALHLPTNAEFRFLYVGGSVERKGVDILLRAYVEEFTGEKDVCLVIKDLGTRTFYRYGNYREQILRLISDASSPPIVYVDKDMTDGQRASLYAACDCLVAPYRGEGFGLPVLEAMACGLPPIVPRGGATDDFVREAEGYFLPAALVECDHDWRLCGPATELSVDVADLRRVMRQAYEKRAETKARGSAAAKRVCEEYTWQITSERMVERIFTLGNTDKYGSSQAIQSDLRDRSKSADGLQSVHHTVDAPLDVTVCLATHNQEQTIANCLARVQPFVREIVVADTGSTDRTVAIVREYGARVYSVAPLDNRSAVRNVALRRATSEWIFSLEPDELIDDRSMETIATILTQQPSQVAGFSLCCRNGLPGIEETDIRLFRNVNQIAYQGRGLPNITDSIRKLNGLVVETPAVVTRSTSTNGQSADVFRLLHLELVDQPNAPESFFRLGLAHFRTGNFFHAECYFREFLRRIDDTHFDYVDAIKKLICCYRAIDEPARAQEWESLLQQYWEKHR